MALPDVKVEIRFDTDNLPQYSLTLDDPIKGQLDNPNYLLVGGFVFFDVSEYLKGVDTQRGKSRILDRYESGTASVRFDNSERIFDPLYTQSQYFGGITPRLEIRISANGEDIYTGVVLDWNLDYDKGGNNIATAVCSDKFTVLAQATTDIFFPDVELSGTRIETILDLPEVSFESAERDIDSGLTTLSGQQISADTVVLDYLQQVEETERGSLFIAKNGDLTFQQRNTPVLFDLLFSDDSSGIPFAEISNVFGTELLYNRIQLTQAGGSTITKTDSTSISAYGVSTYNSTLLHEDETELETLADVLLGRYSQPVFRFDRVIVNFQNLTSQQVTDVLSLEVNDGIIVRFTPSKIGDPIEQAARVVGINHSISAIEHIIELQLESGVSLPFILDVGVLDVNTLGY